VERPVFPITDPKEDKRMRTFASSAQLSARLLAALGAVALAACGGGGHGDDPIQPPVTPGARDCDISSFADLDFDGIARITAVTPEISGEYKYGNRVLPNLPEFCRINGIATPKSDSEINFEVWVPTTEKWNGKLVATGNGGYSPALSYADMAYALRQGYATLGGDTGHQPNDDLIFGVGHPEKIIDWGTRSLNAITVPGKRIVSTLQGEDSRRSYYIGCSTGGQQGFAEVQRYPSDFDGVIAGAPGNNRTALNLEFMWRFLANRPQGENAAASAILQQSDLALLTRKALEVCDTIDGVADEVISDPRACDFNINALACPDDQKNQNCLTQLQINTARKIYGGPKRSDDGAPLYPGWAFGSETQWWSYMAGSAPSRSDFWALWVFADPHWDWWTFDYARDVDYAYRIIAPFVDQTDTDIGAFKSNGGKLIVYHGWNDGVVSPFDSIQYYEDVRAKQDSQAETDSFYRLFLIPGMGHCQGGAGSIAGVIRMENPPEGTELDPGKDILSALDEWVEKGVAPNLTGSNTAGTVTRPICSYPKKIVYKGGEPTRAESFACE
jgi:feruloyl esterase